MMNHISYQCCCNLTNSRRWMMRSFWKMSPSKEFAKWSEGQLVSFHFKKQLDSLFDGHGVNEFISWMNYLLTICCHVHLWEVTMSLTLYFLSFVYIFASHPWRGRKVWSLIIIKVHPYKEYLLTPFCDNQS